MSKQETTGVDPVVSAFQLSSAGWLGKAGLRVFFTEGLAVACRKCEFAGQVFEK
jgi:hypothetical protein